MRKVVILLVLLLIWILNSYSSNRKYLQSLKSSTPQREIAITIDDLPGVIIPQIDDEKVLLILQEMNRKMLAALVKHQVPAIGFVNENGLYKAGQVDSRISLLRAWLDAGMQLGNHTFAHLDFNKMSQSEFEDEVIRGEVVIRQLMKERGLNTFYIRFPFNHDGNTKEKKAAMNAFLKARGYLPAPFTIEHSDYI